MSLNPIVFALRHPVTVMVALAGLVLAAGLALVRMKVDIFPSLNLPVVYVCQPYGGMDPAQMEGLLTNYYEYHFLYVGGIHHVESKNIQGLALMKLFFHPGTDMAQAMAETVQYVNRSRAFMPPGTVPPFVMRFDTGSVPVGYLVLSSDTKTVGEIQDQALFKVRPMFASLPGVSAPPPFGGNARTIVLRVDPDRLRAYSISPEEVVTALTTGNVVSPSGAVRIQDRMPLVPANAMVVQPQELGKIPIRPGSNVYLRDLGVIEDTTDVPTGYALVNGRRAVYILVTKRADASTLSVVNEVKANLTKMQAVLPDDIKVSFQFDQSPYVTRAVRGVGLEGLLGALLTGLMVLVFLRDWRSVIVVVLNIPLALLGSLTALWLTGQTVNLMTLGGLALAVGILVDEATVEVENIHTQMDKTGSIARAVRLGNAETAVPRLLAMLCILAVFLPAFFMQGAARALFAPLALAVGFAMISSYLLSSTFVPVVSVWLLRHHAPPPSDRPGRFSFAAFRNLYARLTARLVRLRWLVMTAALVLCALGIAVGWTALGREIFPRVDAGQFQLRLRAPTGTRIERTEEIAVRALEIVKEQAGGPDSVALSLGYVGVVPSSYPINGVYQWMSGPEEAVLRVALKPGPGRPRTDELTPRLRDELPRRLADWLRPKLAAEGLAPAAIDARVAGLRLSFEPADIVNEVMSFGSPTPVEIVVSGTNFADNRAYADKLKAELAQVPSLRDLQFAQPLDYPTVEVKIDRELAGRSGLTVDNVARSLVAATASSRFVVPNYWRDPKTGIGYQVQVELPIEQMNSAHKIGLVPIKNASDSQVLLQDVARIDEGTMPGEYDRYNMRRLVSITANIQGEDLGRVAGHIAQAIARAGELPKGVQVDVRGQVEPMRQMFLGLALGLGLAVACILLLLTAYFQSLRLALVALAAVPAVIAGVVAALLATGTTLNIQSFTGAIMAVGVAIANAILLVTFAERARREGHSAAAAAVEGARHRLRPILMTSCAMIAGMVPLAVALGEGGEQTAPLGRAVIGGLAAATVATLLVLPCVFAAVMAGAGRRSVSLDPDDPDSPHYEPAVVSADGNGAAVPAAPVLPGVPRLALALPLLAALAAAPGCSRLTSTPAASTTAPASNAAAPAAPGAPAAAAPASPVAVTVVTPVRRDLQRTIEQPATVEAFEETPILGRIPGYVQRVLVDIGDRVKGPIFDDKGRVTQPGQLLAELAVPEVEEELRQKQALVAQAEAEVVQAEASRAAADAAIVSAGALIKEAEATRARAQAAHQRWESEVRRMEGLVQRGILDQQTLDETRNQATAAAAARQEVEARVATANAALKESEAKKAKAVADIAAARARVEVARADAGRTRALLDYSRLRAPFDGVVTRRNVTTGHFYQPAGGAAAQPLFVIARLDTVRVFADIPEADAPFVREGTPARVSSAALKGQEFTGQVTRTAWSLDPRARTLKTEIDLPNPRGDLRPGTFAQVVLQATLPARWTLPPAAVLATAEGSWCYLVQDGQAVRTPVRVGLRTPSGVEILKLQRPAATAGGQPAWDDPSPDDRVIQGNLGSLTDGQPVTPTPAPP